MEKLNEKDVREMVNVVLNAENMLRGVEVEIAEVKMPVEADRCVVVTLKGMVSWSTVQNIGNVLGDEDATVSGSLKGAEYLDIYVITK